MEGLGAYVAPLVVCLLVYLPCFYILGGKLLSQRHSKTWDAVTMHFEFKKVDSARTVIVVP